MSVQAITWVLKDAPDLPAHLVGTLLGLANHADRDGRGAHPRQDVLAWYARKTDRAVRHDLASLLDLGLIRPGDQRLVSHIPADRRPAVYDLAVERRREPPHDRKPTSGRGRKPTSGRSPAMLPFPGGSLLPAAGGSTVPAVTENDRKPASGPTGSPLPTEPSNEPLTPPTPPPSGGEPCSRHKRWRRGCAACAAPGTTTPSSTPFTALCRRHGYDAAACPGCRDDQLAAAGDIPRQSRVTPRDSDGEPPREAITA